MQRNTGNISEIFSSIQGEGLRVGERQIFIRFADCNLNCAYCDTPRKKTGSYTIEQTLAEVKKSNKKAKAKTISITGGEPLLYTEFLKELLPALKKLKLKICLETNATLPENLKKIARHIDVIAADIKLPSVSKEKGLWKQHSNFLKTARNKNIFIKIIVSEKLNMADFKKAVSLIKNINSKLPLIIQPVWQDNVNATALYNLQCYALKFLETVLVIPQVHKVIGVR